MSSRCKNGQKSTKVDPVNSTLREAQPSCRGAQVPEAKTCSPSWPRRKAAPFWAARRPRAKFLQN
ncbi:hypothetical protein A2U01_0108215, partial [Trifolium medium]|nr:hypothetical protein [Trifolium medium]